MKLYILNCGQMITPEGNVLSVLNTKQLKLVIIVPAFLVDHPTQGLVLIDTGFNYEHLPDEMKAGIAQSPIQRLTRQISDLGYAPENVRHVLLSHLHFDHAGQMLDFPHAVFHMRESEWQEADPPSRSDYFPQDYMAGRNFKFEYMPEGEDCDVFGDGSIIGVHTPGHSKGHSSFIVNLPNTGRVLLTVDAAHLPQYLTDERLYSDAHDIPGCRRSIEKIKRLSQKCSLTVFGHDPATFADLRLAPKYYD